MSQLFAPFSVNEISAKIGELLGANVPCPVTLIYKTVEHLHRAIPDYTGDWYFTGDFPTPGGNRVTNQAFINFFEGRGGRAY